MGGVGFTDSFAPNADELNQTENSNNYTYNPYHQVLEAGTDTYTYNKNGEIATDVTGGTTTTDSYNSDSELTQSAITGSSTTAFGFDSDGNRCAQVVSTTQPACSTPPSGASTYGFSAYDQLCWSGSGTTASGEGSCASPPPSGATTTQYHYDGTGLRVSDTTNGNSQNFVYDTQTRGGQPLDIMDGKYAYIYGPASFGAGTAPVEQVPLAVPTSPTYLFSDPNGVRSVMNALGVTSESYNYNAYGIRTGTGLGGLTTTSFGFQGGSYNQNLWMHHLNGDAAYLPV